MNDQEASTTNIMYKSLNHEHEFILSTNKKQRWICDGTGIFGKCKSNANSCFEKERFKCTMCADFDLCRSCLEAPKRELFTSLNHPSRHQFILVSDNDHEWICDGNEIYGNCKSNELNNNFDSTHRYKCLNCADFDLCQACFQEPEIKLFKSENHPHPFKLFNLKSYWTCDGDRVFGKCKSKTTTTTTATTTNERQFINMKKEHFRCTLCEDFDFCKECLELPKLEFFKCENHLHNFIKYDNTSEWTCNGDNVFGKCKSKQNDDDDDDNQQNVNEDGLLARKERFKCKLCNDFDFCRKCLEAPSIRKELEKQRSYSSCSENGSSAGGVGDGNEQQHNHQQQSDGLCCICLESRIDATLVHLNTGTGHHACCIKCANELKENKMSCPICRENIDVVIKNYMI